MDTRVLIDTLWVLIAGMLVFFMNAGFALVESGLCRSKNTVNILAKNFVVFAVAVAAFWAAGFGLMFGDGNGFLGLGGLFLSSADNSPAMGDAYDGIYDSLSWAGVPLEAKFWFQLVFAATAATIVSGAVAERIKFSAFILFAFWITLAIYPISGHWIWGAGWLAERGFWDFAGSTVVHAVGGWAALTGAFLLGPRMGKFGRDGKARAIPGHNLALATLGCFILWLGWFGFNPGSTMSAEPVSISHILLTTNTAAAFGALAATVVSWFVLRKPDLSMILNGCLAGLVAVTAPCAWISLSSAALIGAIGAVLTVFAVIGLDRLRIDDPVGAIPVHLVNGVWGTLAVGLFAQGPWAGGEAAPATGLFFGGGWGQLGAQALGVVAVAGWALLVSAIGWIAIRAALGLRVTGEEEHAGLDLGEHGAQAYPEFGSGGSTVHQPDHHHAPSALGLHSHAIHADPRVAMAQVEPAAD